MIFKGVTGKDGGMGDDCIFCKIVAGELDAHIVYNDEDVVAFLDANPVSDGHLLVVPREHAETLSDLSPGAVGPLFNVVRHMTRGVAATLSPDGVNVLQNNGAGAGQEVGHVHVHIIPRYEDDGLDISFEGGDINETRAADIVERLRAELE